jgi:type VI secretion system protein ImpA
MRGALRALLADRPQLLDMTLMDDTPTANPETRGWLRTEMMLPQAAAEGAMDTASGTGETGNGTEPTPREAVAFAMAEARAGRADRAISMLMREVAREKTSRGRFLVQAQLARIMVDAGHDAVATPILEELIANVEKHQLEQWEAGELVATPLALMYQVLTKTKANESQRQNLYLRICRLDPIQAINFSQP